MQLATSVMPGMLEQISPEYADFSDWLSAFVEIARTEIGPGAVKIIRQYPDIYREHYVEELSPDEAFRREWL